jgi:hypothetical protein
MRYLIITLAVVLLFSAASCTKSSVRPTGCASYYAYDSLATRAHLSIGAWQLWYSQGGFTSDTGLHYPTQKTVLRFYANGNVDFTNGTVVTTDGPWTLQSTGNNTWILLIHGNMYGTIGFCNGLMELDPQFADMPKSVYKQIN